MNYLEFKSLIEKIVLSFFEEDPSANSYLIKLEGLTVFEYLEVKFSPIKVDGKSMDVIYAEVNSLNGELISSWDIKF